MYKLELPLSLCQPRHKARSILCGMLNFHEGCRRATSGFDIWPLRQSGAGPRMPACDFSVEGASCNRQDPCVFFDSAGFFLLLPFPLIFPVKGLELIKSQKSRKALLAQFVSQLQPLCFCLLFQMRPVST